MNDSKHLEWHNLHMEVYATWGQCESKSDDEIQMEINEFLERKALSEQWFQFATELYGFERDDVRHWLTSTSIENIQKELDDFPARKPLLAKLRQLDTELFNRFPKGRLSNMTSEELQMEIAAYPEREQLCKEWRRLSKEVEGRESDMCDKMFIVELKKEIGELLEKKHLCEEEQKLLEALSRLDQDLYKGLCDKFCIYPCLNWPDHFRSARLDSLREEVSTLRQEVAEYPQRAQLCETWRKLYGDLRNVGRNWDTHTCNTLPMARLREDISLFREKNVLLNKWWELRYKARDTHDNIDAYEVLHCYTTEKLQGQIDELIERIPLIEEWRGFSREYFEDAWERAYKRSAKELRRELEVWKKAVVLEEKLRSGSEVTIEGTIVGHEWREGKGRSFCIALDGDGTGYLPLAALAKRDQECVARSYRLKTGLPIRSFEDAYPLYEGMKIRASLESVSDWRRNGSIPVYQLTNGAVVGPEDKLAVVPRGSNPQALPIAEGNENNVVQSKVELHVGDVVVGHVQNTAKYGVFVDLEGGVTGLLHVKDTGMGYVGDLAAVFVEGDAVKVEVSGIGEKDGRSRVGFRLLAFPDKAPLAAGAGKELPTLLMDGPGLWRSLGDWKGKGLTLLLDACRKVRRRAVLVADAGLERDMEQAGDADGLALIRDLRENHPSSLFVCPEGADSVGSAMRRRACIQQCRIVSNNAALASVVGVEACSVTSDAGGLSVPQLGLRCESTTAVGTASTPTASKILVDGVNCILAKLGGKGLATVLRALKEAGRVPFTFFDASLQGTPDKDLQALIQRLTASGEACVVPSGSDMDDYLLPMADSCGLDIVTNKRFHGKEGKYPWLTKRTEEGKRLHPFSVVDGMLLIPSLDICTPLEHGTVTKEVTEANT